MVKVDDTLIVWIIGGAASNYIRMCLWVDKISPSLTGLWLRSSPTSPVSLNY